MLPPEKRRFNRELSSLRIAVEYTIGIWKSQWSFLRCIPNVGNLSRNQMKQIYQWISASVVLHNLLTQHGDTLTQEEIVELDDDEVLGQDEEIEVDRNQSTMIGGMRRELLLEEFIRIE